ncbi:hypothetical protein C7271_23190, partial [filamentous cyanobacterium CCP5]
EGQTYLDRAAEFGGDGALPALPDMPHTADFAENLEDMADLAPRSVSVMPPVIDPEEASLGADIEIGLETDVPLDLWEAVEGLPGEADVAGELGAEVPLPPDIAAIESFPAEPEVPPAMKAGALGDGTVLTEPAELDEMIEALQGSPGAQVAPGRVSPGEPVLLEIGEMMGTQSGESNVSARVDDPDAGSSDELADLPPEVLAALEGIPEDSPDRFDLPEADAESASTNPLTTPPVSILTISQSGDRIYAVWTLSDSDRDRARQGGGEQLALRLYDVTESADPGQLLQEQHCYELAQDWYLTPPACDRTYRAELGYLRSDGWIFLATSEPLFIPC